MVRETLLCVLTTTSICFGQSPTTETTSTFGNFVDNISVDENFSLINYKGSSLPNGNTTLIQFIQGVDYKISDSFSIGLDIPVYVSDATDFGAIETTLTWSAGSAWKNADMTLDLGVGVSSPMETVFGASSVDPSLSGVFTYNLPWASLQFVQGVNYEFVTGDAYSLPFGSKVSDDILTADTSVYYPVSGELKLGGTVLQNYTVVNDGQQNISVGPNLAWNITNNVNLNGGVSIPVYQNVNNSAEQNYVMSASLAIKF